MAEASADGVWVGPEFGRGALGQKRLLLVSLRDPLEPSQILRVGRSFDARLTAKYIDGTMKHQTFTDVARLLLGGPVERSDCERLWRAVAFANLPGPSAGSRTEPKLAESDVEAGATELARLMSRLAPDCLIIFDALLAKVLVEREPAAGAVLARPNDWVTVPHPGTPGFSFREHTGGVRALLGRPGEGNRAVDH